MITAYENVAGISGKMLDAARAGDWEQLKVLEAACAQQVGMLKNTPEKMKLSEQQRQNKVRLLHIILQNDRHIREITDPWMSKLHTLMQSNSTERKLKHAYGG